MATAAGGCARVSALAWKQEPPVLTWVCFAGNHGGRETMEVRGQGCGLGGVPRLARTAAGTHKYCSSSAVKPPLCLSPG